MNRVSRNTLVITTVLLVMVSATATANSIRNNCKVTNPSGLVDTLPKQAIQLVLGYGLHGSGDLKGIVFSTEYVKYLTKKFSLTYNIRGSINSGKDEITVNNTSSGAKTDASVRFTTAGVQLGVNGGYSFIRNQRHELRVSLGAFGRYQSASNGSDGYSVYYPPLYGIPEVVIGYNNRTPQETISAGALLQLQYDYTFSNKFYLGVVPGFQTDTNGDTIAQLGIAIGKRF